MINTTIPLCPVCGMENTHPDGDNFICPDCSHEWLVTSNQEEAEEQRVHKDVHGNVLNDSDTVTLIKDLKVKGPSLAIKKSGTKIKKIHLVDGDHDIDCKIDVRVCN